MARGTQLGQLIDDLRAEVRHSLQPGLGTDARIMLTHAIERTQELLYDSYDWPFLRILPYKDLQADSRYYNLPEGLNLERVEKVVTYWGSQPRLVERGITWEHYAAFDPDKSERTDPVLRWDVRWVPALESEQIEVWPLPASNGQKLQFQGLRPLRRLTQDDDVADLDDRLIVLTAAADLLAGARRSGAEEKRGMANQRFNTLKGRLKTGQHVTHLTGGSEPRYRGGSAIHIASSAPSNGSS